ncbi:MAG: hypothetical protein HZC55_13320 [Verrucomicrobia bacterium]|nr:hypothetical protein [Verrucomicrobiota bacterium]
MSVSPDSIQVAWLPLSEDPALLASVLAQAGPWGVRAVHLSHALCHDADDLLEDAGRAERMAEFVRRCRAAGLRVWCWTHEICRPPADCLQAGQLDFDAPALWQHLAAKYQRFLTAVLPDLEGLVLTCAETDFLVYHDRDLRSGSTRPARTTRLARALHDCCRRHGCRLALRDFVYRRTEVSDMAQAIGDCPPDLIVMTKSVPHDWHPFYPSNPLLGAVGGREQWMELDLGHEYEGQHLYPYAEVEANLVRLRDGYARGVRTFAVRLDRAVEFRGVSALHCPWGRLELLTLRRFAEDPGVAAETIWGEWERTQFPGARRAVELATRAVQTLLFPQRFWYADHSRLPTWEYAATHLVDGNADRLPIWTGRAEDAAAEAEFRGMSATWRQVLQAEAREGLALARECVRLIRGAPHAAPELDAWRQAADSLEAWSELFALHREAFFAIEVLRWHSAPAGAAAAESAVDELERACVRWAPRLAHQRLENERATAHFPRVIASLRTAAAARCSGVPVAPSL